MMYCSVLPHLTPCEQPSQLSLQLHRRRQLRRHPRHRRLGARRERRRPRGRLGLRLGLGLVLEHNVPSLALLRQRGLLARRLATGTPQLALQLAQRRAAVLRAAQRVEVQCHLAPQFLLGGERAAPRRLAAHLSLQLGRRRLLPGLRAAAAAARAKAAPARLQHRRSAAAARAFSRAGARAGARMPPRRQRALCCGGERTAQ